jgi:hypothetical protein
LNPKPTPPPKHPSPFVDTGDDNDGLIYDPQNIHFDFSRPKKRTKLLPNGDEVLITDDTDSEDGFGSVMNKVDEIIPKISSMVQDTVTDVNKTLNRESDRENGSNQLQDGDGNSLGKVGSDNDENNSDGDRNEEKNDVVDGNNLQNEEKIAHFSIFETLSTKIKNCFHYFFPTDIIDVLDLTVTQLVRLFALSAACVKGYLLGGIVALGLRVPLLTYTKTCLNIAFYPYLITYIALSAYILLNFVHISAVALSEFPVIKQFVLLGIELHRLTTAPPYMVARLLFKYSRALLKAKEEIEKTKENQTGPFSWIYFGQNVKSKNDTNSGTTNELNNREGLLISIHNNSTQSPTDIIPTYNSDGSLEFINQNGDIIDVEANDIYDQKHTSRKQSTSGHDDESSQNDDSIFPSFRFPNDILSELHESLEQLNQETEDVLYDAHRSKNDGKLVDILTDDLITISQDVKHDTTLVELSTPTVILGSNFRITTSNADIVLHA